MKSLNDLYHILSRELSEDTFSYDIHLSANHIIYQAHFPSNPITPGVCVIQIATELVEYHFNQRFRIQKVKNVKFLNVMSPVENPDLVYKYTNITKDNTTQTYKLQVQVLSEGSLMAKLSFICK